MKLNITARHLELTPAISDYVTKKFSRVGRHFSTLIRASVVLSVQKRVHSCEVVTHSKEHHDFRARETAADLYAAIDAAVDVLHRHMDRQKDKHISEKRRLRQKLSRAVGPALDASEEPVSLLKDRVTTVRRLTPKSIPLSEAVEALDSGAHPYVVFSSGDVLHLLIKRNDKELDLVEIHI